MSFLKKMVASAAVGAIVIVGGAGVASAWHANLSASQQCVAEQGIYQDTYTLTNPAEPWWNSTRIENHIDNPDGLVFDKNILQYGEVATAHEQVRGDSKTTSSHTVRSHWVDKVTGKTVDMPSSASASLSHSGTCVPPKSNVDFTASVVCTPLGGPHGTSEFTLHVNQTSPAPPTATFEPANGTKLNSGEPVTVTATWHDEFYGQLSKPVTTDPVGMCTTTPPPPETPKPSQPVVIPPPAVLTSTPVDTCPTSSATCLAHTGKSSTLPLALTGAGAVAAGLAGVYFGRRKTFTA